MSVVEGSYVARFCKSFTRINPNGVDLAPKSVSVIPRNAVIFLHGDERGYLVHGSEMVRDKKSKLLPDRDGYYNFRAGSLYVLRFPEVTIPPDCTGFAFPRSSLNRLGVMKFETAVFDSGYSGEPTQTIFTPIKALVHKEEAMIQLVFLRNEKSAKKLYVGRYQHEKG